jgi:hypothetical protein
MGCRWPPVGRTPVAVNLPLGCPMPYCHIVIFPYCHIALFEGATNSYPSASAVYLFLLWAYGKGWPWTSKSFTWACYELQFYALWVNHSQGAWPAAIFYPFWHPTPCTFDSISGSSFSLIIFCGNHNSGFRGLRLGTVFPKVTKSCDLGIINMHSQ